MPVILAWLSKFCNYIDIVVEVLLKSVYILWVQHNEFFHMHTPVQLFSRWRYRTFLVHRTLHSQKYLGSENKLFNHPRKVLPGFSSVHLKESGFHCPSTSTIFWSLHNILYILESQSKCVAAVWKWGRVKLHQLDLIGCEDVWILEGGNY